MKFDILILHVGVHQENISPAFSVGGQKAIDTPDRVDGKGARNSATGQDDAAGRWNVGRGPPAVPSPFPLRTAGRKFREQQQLPACGSRKKRSTCAPSAIGIPPGAEVSARLRADGQRAGTRGRAGRRRGCPEVDLFFTLFAL